MATKKAKKLPNKLSDLIDLAVKDCKALSKKKGFKLNMLEWIYNYGSTCHVCMAGAVMVNTLKIDSKYKCYPSDLKDPVNIQLYKIDHIREGDLQLETDFEDWDLAKKISKLEKLIKKDFDYGKGRAKWSTYTKVAKELRKLGF